MNLLSNACKFTADGEIEIKSWILTPEEVRCQMEREKVNSGSETDSKKQDMPVRSRLYISVKDSGCGMSQEDQRKLFKDFTTLKSNAHLNPNGVGLGLSICKKIVTHLNGDIWV